MIYIWKNSTGIADSAHLVFAKYIIFGLVILTRLCDWDAVFDWSQNLYSDFRLGILFFISINIPTERKCKLGSCCNIHTKGIYEFLWSVDLTTQGWYHLMLQTWPSRSFFFQSKKILMNFWNIFIEPKFDSKNVDFKEITILFQTYKIVKVLVPQDKNTDSMFISYKF